VREKIVGTLPTGYQIEKISIIPESVRISGPESIVGTVGSLFTEPIDLAGVDPSDGEEVVGVPLVLSAASLRFVPGQPREVQVRIRFRLQESSQRQPIVPAGSYHVVRKGETLWEIGRRYGLTVDELRRRNGLARETPIQPGQRLKLGDVGSE
jgi:hypothetical protein